MNAPQITLYRGYNAHSRTLRGPFWVTGMVGERVTQTGEHSCRINEGKPACFGESIPPGVMQWFDIGIRPQSGDYAMIWTAGDQVCKKLVEIDGEWFAVCHFYTVPVAWIPDVRAVGVLVAEATIPGLQPLHVRHQVMTTDADDTEWRRELNSRPKVHKAIGHMIEHGIPRAA